MRHLVLRALLLTGSAFLGAAASPARADKPHGVDISTLDKTTAPTKNFLAVQNPLTFQAGQAGCCQSCCHCPLSSAIFSRASA